LTHYRWKWILQLRGHFKMLKKCVMVLSGYANKSASLMKQHLVNYLFFQKVFNFLMYSSNSYLIYASLLRCPLTWNCRLCLQHIFFEYLQFYTQVYFSTILCLVNDSIRSFVHYNQEVNITKMERYINPIILTSLMSIVSRMISKATIWHLLLSSHKSNAYLDHNATVCKSFAANSVGRTINGLT